MKGAARPKQEGCQNPACGRHDIRALGRCQACYVFFRRHGRDPTVAEMRRRRKETPCRICRQRPVRARGRCHLCYQYWWRTGQERPVDAGADLCVVCRQRPVYRQERCRSCYAYRHTQGRDRE